LVTVGLGVGGVLAARLALNEQLRVQLRRGMRGKGRGELNGASGRMRTGGRAAPGGTGGRLRFRRRQMLRRELHRGMRGGQGTRRRRRRRGCGERRCAKLRERRRRQGLVSDRERAAATWGKVCVHAAGMPSLAVGSNRAAASAAAAGADSAPAPITSRGESVRVRKRAGPRLAALAVRRAHWLEVYRGGEVRGALLPGRG
jgi:hypothetical protein